MFNNFTSNSQSYDYPIGVDDRRREKDASVLLPEQTSKKIIASFMQPSLRKEKERAEVEYAKAQFELTRPLKSACFDFEQ